MIQDGSVPNLSEPGSTQPESDQSSKPKLSQAIFKNKLWLIGGIVVVVVIIAIAAFALVQQSGDKDMHDQMRRPQNSTDHNSNNNVQAGEMSALATDPVAKGQFLSNGQCKGSGDKTLTHAPLDVSDIGSIIPMGLTLASHVTPVDHEYYYQKNQMAPKDTYNVYAPADGTIVDVEQHGDDSSQDERWRVVINYSCTFMSYYDLMTDFALKDQLPAAFGPNNHGGINIPVKAGEVIGKVGGQSLDFAVWDTTKTLKGLLYPQAYANAEPWKINTVDPLNYFSTDVKEAILPKYVGDQTPKDGNVGYDQSGKAVGNWFLKGSNGYAGTTDPRDHDNGYKGHLALVYDHVDTKKLTVSTGNYQGQAAQFAVVGNKPDFAQVDASSGVVKYQLADRSWVTGSGAGWNGSEFAQQVTLNPGQNKATLLIQVTGNDQLKVEFFPGKAPDQVSGFTPAAMTYDRGQDAKPLADPSRQP